jgi:hypothetical protein
VQHVIAREECVSPGDGFFPFIEWKKVEPRLAVEPPCGLFRVVAHRHRLAGRNVKRFSDRCVPIRDREVEGLSYVLGMDMLQGRRAIAGKDEGHAVAELLENRRVEVSGRIDRVPSGTGDVTRVEDRRGKAARGFPEQIVLYCRFLYPVLAERLSR